MENHSTDQMIILESFLHIRISGNLVKRVPKDDVSIMSGFESWSKFRNHYLYTLKS